MRTRIFPGDPPMSFQSVITPVKIFATWSFVRDLTGFDAATAIGPAPPQLAPSSAPTTSRYVRKERIRALLMGRIETIETLVSDLCIGRSIPPTADSRYTSG